MYVADVALERIYYSAELAVSRVLRTFLWCLIWIFTSFYMERPTSLAWWDFRGVEENVAANFWIEQTFVWMVFMDFTADLIAAERKLSFVLSFRAVLDMVTMPVTALFIQWAFSLAHLKNVDECVQIAEDEPFAFSIAQCGPFNPQPRVFLTQV